MISFTTEQLKDVHIKPDRFGLAAISMIYKAFGDNVRSKELWPWSERIDINWAWENQNEKDTFTILEYAKQLINYAQQKIDLDENESNENSIELSSNKSVKDLKHRLNKLTNSINSLDDVTKAINSTTETLSNDIEVINEM